jgi:hypothetical protein
MKKGKARENGQGKTPKTMKKMGCIPSGVTNFFIGLIGKYGH